MVQSITAGEVTFSEGKEEEEEVIYAANLVILIYLCSHYQWSLDDTHALCKKPGSGYSGVWCTEIPFPLGSNASVYGSMKWSPLLSWLGVAWRSPGSLLFSGQFILSLWPCPFWVQQPTLCAGSISGSFWLEVLGNFLLISAKTYEPENAAGSICLNPYETSFGDSICSTNVYAYSRINFLSIGNEPSTSLHQSAAT